MTSEHAPVSRLQRHDELAQKQQLETTPTSELTDPRVRGPVWCGRGPGVSQGRNQDVSQAEGIGGTGKDPAPSSLLLWAQDSGSCPLWLSLHLQVAVWHHPLLVLLISAFKGSVFRGAHRKTVTPK